MPLRIVVAVKPVPRAATPARFDPGSLRLDRTGPSELNQPDEHAIEEALLLRDKVGGEIVAIAVTPPTGIESLRTALAMGVDRAVAVSDPVLEGSDLLATSRVLAAAVMRESPDVVIFGSQATDGAGAMLWAAVAERLEMPVLSSARNLELVQGRLRAIVQRADGSRVVDAPTPCIVALSGAVNSPRYPAFKGIVAAKKQQIPVLTAADLAIGPDAVGAAGSGTAVLSLTSAPARAVVAELVTDEGQGAEWLYNFIRKRVAL